MNPGVIADDLYNLGLAYHQLGDSRKMMETLHNASLAYRKTDDATGVERVKSLLEGNKALEGLSAGSQMRRMVRSEADAFMNIKLQSILESSKQVEVGDLLDYSTRLEGREATIIADESVSEDLPQLARHRLIRDADVTPPKAQKPSPDGEASPFHRKDAPTLEVQYVQRVDSQDSDSEAEVRYQASVRFTSIADEVECRRLLTLEGLNLMSFLTKAYSRTYIEHNLSTVESLKIVFLR
jgi:hypothetical protein